MKHKIVPTILAACAIATLCSAFGPANQEAESVSLIRLVAAPDVYHGKLVRVIGVSNIEFEGNAVWVSKEHYKHHVVANSVWIEPDYKALQATPEQLQKFNGKYVLMEGVFDKDDSGHMGLHSGTLKQVSRFNLWEREGTANK